MRPFAYVTVIAIAIASLLTSCNQCYDRVCDDVVDETYVHRYGVAVPQEQWASSGAHGQVITTLKNGVVVSKTYNAGTLDGDTTYTFPHSETIQKVEMYSQGTLLKEVTHYLSGAPYQDITYQSPNKKLIMTWYESGSPQSKEEYQNDTILVNGEYYTPSHQLESRVDNGEGSRTNRDGYGQLISLDSIQNGQMALSTTYHPNGSPKALTPYKNGKIEGERKTYLPAGEPDTNEQWVAGVQHGTSLIYQNGEKYAEVPYVAGKKEGTERRYRDGSTLVEEIPWVDGQKHGVGKTFIGNAVKSNWYFDDKAVSKGDYDLLSNPLVK